ncbi:MAG TPA: hypothetical protein VD735_07620 [Candidatus Saccharimonadales bacterium]|nr:hypothetical protein [Candidatus Saccharimonadales bacterium]
MSHYMHLEGMDLSGKTTTAARYAEQSPLDWRVNHNSISEHNPIYELADKLRLEDAYDPEVVGNVYVAALMGDMRTFERPSGINVIQDSTIVLRSLAYHTVKKTPRLGSMLQDIAAEHPRFDASFYLYADMDARRDRLAQRQAERPWEVAEDDLMILKDPKRFEDMEAMLQHWSTTIFNSTVIDTTEMTPMQVHNAIADKFNPGVNNDRI